MGSQDVQAGSAFIRYYVKRDELDKGVNEIAKSLAKTKTGLDAIGESRAAASLSNVFKAQGVEIGTRAMTTFTAAVTVARQAIESLRVAASRPISIPIGLSTIGLAGMAGGPAAAMDKNLARQIANTRSIRSVHSSLTRTGPHWLNALLDPKGTRRFDQAAERSIIGKDAFDRKYNTDAGARGRSGEFLLRGQSSGAMPAALSGIANPSAAAPVGSNVKSPAAVKSIAATTMAAATVATSAMARSVSMADRVRASFSRAGSSMLGFGVKMGLAGAAMSAAAVPFEMLTNTFAKSADEVRKYAKEHGVTLPEAIKKTNSELTVNQVKLGVALYDSWGKISKSAKAAWESVAASIGEALGPELTEKALAIQGLIKWVKAAGKEAGVWVKNNAALVGGFVAAGAAIAAAGTAIGAIGIGLTVAGSLMGTVGTLIAALMSPITLVTAAVIGGGYAWIKYTDSGKQALESFLRFVKPFVQIATDTMTGVKDAFVGGDLGLAWKVLLAGMQTAALEALEYIRDIFGDQIGEIGEKIVTGDLSGAWSSAVELMGNAWGSFCEYVYTTFANVGDKILAVYEDIVNDIAETMAENGIMATLLSPVTTDNKKMENWLREKLGKPRADLSEDDKLSPLDRQRKKALEESAGRADSRAAESRSAGKEEEAKQHEKNAEDIRRRMRKIGTEKQEEKDANTRKQEKYLADKFSTSNGEGGKVSGQSPNTERKPREESQALKDARKKLAELAGEADKKAEKARVKGLDEPDIGTGKKAASRSFVTSSAASAIAAGFGGGVDPLVDLSRQQLKEMRKQAKADEEALKEVTKLNENLDKLLNKFKRP